MSSWFTRSDSPATETRRTRRDRLKGRKRSLSAAIASVAVGALLAIGLPTMAFAEGETDTGTDATSEAVETDAPAEESTPAPSPAPEEKKAEKKPEPKTEEPSEEPAPPASEEAAPPTEAEETPSTEKTEEVAPEQQKAVGVAPMIAAPGNTSDCTNNCATLKITNVVVGGGPGTPASWAISAVRQSNNDNYNFTSGQTRSVPRGNTYTLASVGGPAEYAQTFSCDTDWTSSSNSNAKTVTFASWWNGEANCTFTFTKVNPASITVQVGGDRTGFTAISGLGGVTLQLYTDNGGSKGSLINQPWAECVSNASGQCVFTIPAPNGAAYWVAQKPASAPGGWFQNNSLAIGSSPSSSEYTFKTPAVSSGQNISSQNQFMVASDNSNNIASGGIWQNSRENPVFVNRCGVRVALVIDLSGSVAGSFTALKDAAKGFVTALQGTPSEVGIFTFNNTAPASAGANYASTPVSTVEGADELRDHIDTFTTPVDATNWDRGIYQVAQSSDQYDVAIVITDGNPTVYGNDEGPGNRTRFREVENGVFSANAVKALKTRVIAFGVGAGVGGSPDNLKAISGGTLDSDYFQTSDYTDAGNKLRDLALGTCEGSISIVKQVVNENTTGESKTGQTPAAGWEFTTESQSAGVTPATQTDETQPVTGAVNFPLEFAGGTTSGTVKVTENLAAQPGYGIVTSNGKNAVCTNVNTGASVAVTNDGAAGFTVPVTSTGSITCTVWNRPPLPQANVKVQKNWVINGTAYTNGNQPLGSAQLQIDGANTPWNSVQSNYTLGDTVDLTETTSFGDLNLCRVTKSSVTLANGSVVDAALPYTATLSESANTFTITNVVTCDSELTLVKQVDNGDAGVTDWELDAVAPDGALDGPSGVSGSDGATAQPVTPQVRYPLTEVGDPRYVQTILQGGNPVAPSTGSWICRQIDEQGVVIPGFNDGINGGVTPLPGMSIRCTAINQTASLTLVKSVQTLEGASAVPSDWDLIAEPVDPPAGLGIETLKSGDTAFVRPGTTYDLSEANGPNGYEQVSIRCNTGANGEYEDTTTVTLPALGTATCVFTNAPIPPKLSLTKVVTNDVVDADNWTLSASRDDNDAVVASGDGGTNGLVEVPAGVAFTLAETTGLANADEFQAGTWSCTLNGDDLPGGPAVPALAPGDEAECTVTNTATPVNPTITKVGGTAVDNGDGTWTLPYTITVTNPSATTGVIYDLVDELDLPASVTQSGAATVTSAPAGVTPEASWTGNAPDTLLADDIALAGGAAAHVYEIAVPVTIGADAAASTCPSDEGLNNTATLESGNQSTDATACVSVDPPDITHEKSVVPGSVVQAIDGTWSISYTVVVTNNGPLGGVYSLADALNFGVGVDLSGASYTVDHDGNPIVWNGSGALVTDEYLAGDSDSTFTIGVTGIVLEGPDLTPAQTACPTGEGAGAFRNESSLTVGGVTVNDDACDSPSAPVITKSGATTAQQPDSSWNVEYTLTVTNTAPGAKPSYYSLSDQPAFPAGVTFNSYAIDGGAPVAYDGSTAIDIVTDAPIAVGETIVTTITLNVEVPTGSVPDAELVCATENAPDGVGFLNGATLTSGEIIRTDDDCIDITDGGTPTVTKTVDTITQDGDGLWTIVYDVTVTGNDTYVTKYTLDDTLRYGPSVEVVSAEWDGEGDSGSWSDPVGTPTTTIVGAPGKIIGVDGVHTYTVTVTANVDAEGFADATTNTCDATENDPNVGFLNEATLTSGTSTTSATACGTPAEPEITKIRTAAEAVWNGDHWEVGYTITVTNTNATQALVYDLDDTPDFTSDVTITDRQVSSTDVTVNPGWNGAAPSTESITANQVLLGGVTHTYNVTISFTVDDVPGDPSHLCEGEGGQGLLNGAVATSGDTYSAEDCVDVPVTVVLEKEWVINGGDPIAWDDASLPSGFTAQGTLNGGDVAWGDVSGPFTEGDDVTIDETGVELPDGCTLTGSTGLGDETLVDTMNTFTVTNEVECEQSVTLTKVVDNLHGGDGESVDWAVSGTNVGDDTDTFTGSGTVTGDVMAGVGYQLNEVSTIWANPAEYTVSSTWTCSSEQGDDAFSLVSSEGATNATLTVNTYGASVDCEITNTDVAPTLTLVKKVAPAEVAANFPPTFWNLTAMDGDDTVVEGPGGGTGEVDSNTPYTLGESADFPEMGEFEAGPWMCTVTSSDPSTPAVLDDGEVTLGVGQHVTCEITNTAKPAEYTFEKSVTSTEQQPDGTWEMVYSITVENLSGVSSVVYDLEDSLDLFGDGITINSADWTSSTSDSGSWDDLPATLTAVLADGASLAPGTIDTYTVTVNATVTAEAWSNETAYCSSDEIVGEGGFRNVGTLTVNEEPTERSACDEPAEATAVKTVVGSPTYTAPATFTVDYEITVTNDSEKDLFYDLSDTPAFPAGTSFTATATDPDSNPVAGWTGEAGSTELTVGDAIAANSTETWTITAEVDVALITDVDTALCVANTAGNGLFNGAEFTTGTITSEISDCVDLEIARLTLVKNVDNTPLDELPVTGGEPSDWKLTADGESYTLAVFGSTVGAGGVVPEGSYYLSEMGIDDPSSPLVPDYYDASEWQCSGTTVIEGELIELEVGQEVTCEITNTANPVDIGIEKAAVLPDGVTAVDNTGDNEFEWVLTVTNNGRDVENLEVTDLIDSQLEITGPATFDPSDGWTEGTVGNAFGATYTGTFPSGQVTTITIPVKMLDPEVIDTPPAVGPDDPTPPIPVLDESPIPNQACVAITGPDENVELDQESDGENFEKLRVRNLDDLNPDNDCAEAEVPVKRIQPTAYVRCVNDVPYLYYDVQATENVEPGTITVTWTSADGTQTKVQTIPWDERNGRLLWPGAAVDADGMPYLFPGWRPITEEDLTNPPTPGVRFLDLILDDTLDTYPWRDTENGATIEFSVNPSQAVYAVYPQALPTCAVDRPGELEIEKTASTESAAPGDSFDYTLAVTSVGTGATADGTTLVDEIPSNLKVDKITTDAAPAFPRWENCEVTGQSASGYGGTLTCDLLGVLGPNYTTAPDVTLDVTVDGATTVNSIDNTGEVCWSSDGDPDATVECADDTVTVSVPHTTPAVVPGMPITGFAGAPWLWAGGGLLLIGGLVLALTMIRRRKERESE